MTAIRRDFEAGERSGVWHWFAVTSALQDHAREAPRCGALGLIGMKRWRIQATYVAIASNQRDEAEVISPRATCCAGV